MKKFASVLALALLLPWIGRAEDPVATKFYTLNFVVQEVDGARTVNSRAYSVISPADPAVKCLIRTNSQVTLGTATQQQSYDVGVTFDVSYMKEVESGLSLLVSAILISLPADLPTTNIPVLRKNTWSGTVLVPIKRPTVIFSSDDVSSKHTMQVVLTATPIKKP